MIMETLRCGYPMAGLSAPISPSTTPSDSDGSFAPHLYASQGFTTSPYETDSTATKFEDVSNNNHPNGAYYSDSLSLSSSSDSSSSSSSSSDDLNRRRHRTSSLLSGLSSLSIAESDETCYSFSEDASVMSESPDCSNLMTPPLASAPLEESPLASKQRLMNGKKNCRSRSKSCSVQPETTEPKTDNSRKDSFVYDVRLPDEQFLFFVPDLDLVKSHLMFAVREEVDVLKERIVELMDRIKHLECENTMLRQYASPEVLQQIQSQMPMQMQQQPPQSHHSSS